MYRFLAVLVLVAATVFAQKPFELKTEGDSVSLSIAGDGIAMLEFVKLAQTVTGRSFTFSAKEIAAADPVKLTGSVRMKKDEFLQFVKTMLYVKGFDAVVRGEGDTAVIELVATRGAKRPVEEARYVAEAELAAHKVDDSIILTSVALAHVAAQDVIDRLRPVLAATATEATLGRADKTLLVQGAGAEVYCASRMVRLIDVPTVRVFEVVALKHAVATELVAGLQALVAGRTPKVVVVAHDSANSLMISGARAVVDELVDLAGLLDRPARR